MLGLFYGCGLVLNQKKLPHEDLKLRGELKPKVIDMISDKNYRTMETSKIRPETNRTVKINPAMI
jgi:hypothetical protein